MVEIVGVGEEEKFSGEAGVFNSKSSPVHHPLRTDRDTARARYPRS